MRKTQKRGDRKQEKKKESKNTSFPKWRLNSKEKRCEFMQQILSLDKRKGGHFGNKKDEERDRIWEKVTNNKISKENLTCIIGEPKEEHQSKQTVNIN